MIEMLQLDTYRLDLPHRHLLLVLEPWFVGGLREGKIYVGWWMKGRKQVIFNPRLYGWVTRLA